MFHRGLKIALPSLALAACLVAPNAAFAAEPTASEPPAPVTTTASNPTKAEESAPAKAEESTPAKAKESAPAKAEESAPAKAEESTPAKAEESAPAKAEESAPAKAEGSTPAKAESTKVPEVIVTKDGSKVAPKDLKAAAQAAQVTEESLNEALAAAQADAEAGIKSARIIGTNRDGCVLTISTVTGAPGTYTLDIWDDGEVIAAYEVTTTAPGLVTFRHTITKRWGEVSPGLDLVIRADAEELDLVRLWDDPATSQQMNDIFANCAAIAEAKGKASCTERTLKGTYEKATKKSAKPAAEGEGGLAETGL